MLYKRKLNRLKVVKNNRKKAILRVLSNLNPLIPMITAITSKIMKKTSSVRNSATIFSLKYGMKEYCNEVK